MGGVLERGRRVAGDHLARRRRSCAGRRRDPRVSRSRHHRVLRRHRQGGRDLVGRLRISVARRDGAGALVRRGRGDGAAERPHARAVLQLLRHGDTVQHAHVRHRR
nr:MAG TPA: hypothetical protein [Caudoviricetes sp.]